MSKQDDLALLRELAHLFEDEPVSNMYWAGWADALEKDEAIPEYVAFMNYARSVKRNVEERR